MLALNYLYQILSTFRHLFSRRSTWVSFCLVILGLIGNHHTDGLSSLCRFWRMDEADYHRLLHFFHSSAWCLDALVAHWGHCVVSQRVAVTVEGRAVLLGDHTYVVKDAMRMPGVVTLHQDSQTQSKPSYFRGHHWGVVGLVVGSLSQAFCLPLNARLHQGFAHLLQDAKTAADGTTAAAKPTLCRRLLDMALQFAHRHDCPSILVVDAFFATGPVFELAASLWSRTLKAPYVHILTRAKKNYGAYHLPLPTPTRRRGRPRKYGDKVKLQDVFATHHTQFSSATCQVYGKVETISYLALNLLWKPIQGPLRFVFAVTSRGPIVLMGSDLRLEPLTAISLYCARVRVETMFAMLKSLLGAFAYRFWSKHLPRHSRKPKKNACLKKPHVAHLPHVQRTWQACESFVLLGCIALGLLQLMALRFHSHIWDAFNLFLRTRSRSLPSEKTVKAVLAQELWQDLHSLAPSAMMQIIRPGRSPKETSANREPDAPSREAPALL